MGDRGEVSCWISGEHWPIAFYLPTSPKKSRIGSASTILGAEASNVKLSAYDVMSRLEIGQSDTKCVNGIIAYLRNLLDLSMHYGVIDFVSVV